mmetsp:Transcript_58015/g.93930  ORF Transcript_58015/g.93930 Transcript_58015/m.93930 type:complete len:215 (+) Transcript_58015:409-1053(+)
MWKHFSPPRGRALGNGFDAVTLVIGGSGPRLTTRAGASATSELCQGSPGLVLVRSQLSGASAIRHLRACHANSSHRRPQEHEVAAGRRCCLGSSWSGCCHRRWEYDNNNRQTTITTTTTTTTTTTSSVSVRGLLTLQRCPRDDAPQRIFCVEPWFLPLRCTKSFGSSDVVSRCSEDRRRSGVDHLFLAPEPKVLGLLRIRRRSVAKVLVGPEIA